jgi:hypothetical protein
VYHHSQQLVQRLVEASQQETTTQPPPLGRIQHQVMHRALVLQYKGGQLMEEDFEYNM